MLRPALQCQALRSPSHRGLSTPQGAWLPQPLEPSVSECDGCLGPCVQLGAVPSPGSPATFPSAFGKAPYNRSPPGQLPVRDRPHGTDLADEEPSSLPSLTTGSDHLQVRSCEKEPSAHFAKCELYGTFDLFSKKVFLFFGKVGRNPIFASLADRLAGHHLLLTGLCRISLVHTKFLEEKKNSRLSS